ncbi:hypothetical protein GKJPGBOP_07200 [Streptomyces paromomycinus]|uniref:DUF4240 domain-containing protein n=2 Tax=Streptomyces paromomycinus TaxID=92743 RepID=A0A401WDK4_STREY|nr:hypothetical protein GKJPGBOP_07200 [Streptomyces paromomycinus]
MLTAMNEDTFWQLIDACTPTGPDPDSERLAAALTEHLARSPVYVVTGFAEQLSWALYRLDRRELGQGLSGDSFLYTRCAVVAAGREVFEGVLRDPSAFAPFATDLIWAESLLYAPDHAYERITGEEWHRATRYSYESYANTKGWAA